MKNIKILIVEDEYIIANDIQMSLESMGYTVCALAASGEQAISKTKEHLPDLILMDIMLKGDMDGIETAKHITESFDIPVVFLTAYSDDEILERAKEICPFSYLIKPFKERELKTSIEVALYKFRMEKNIIQLRSYKPISILSGGIAHDFNNLLTGILGFIDLAIMDAKHGSDIHINLNYARDQCLNAIELVNHFLTLSEWKASGKKAGSMELFIKELADKIIAEKNIGYCLSFEKDVKDVEYDENLMEDAICEIINNAADAMPKGGLLEISGKNIKVEKKNSRHGLPMNAGEYVKISFKDNGPGIPKEILHKVFIPYFTTKEIGSRKGTGLGLALVNAIIKKHNGSIHIDSKEKEGTTITIFLPAHNKK